MRRVFQIVLLLLISGAALGQSYRWPLDLTPQLTSSFGEYRTGRFHAGVDLRTGGIGLPVYAAGSGYVSRVRCSPYGYGKAVYVQLQDGTTAVYAHLDDYSDSLRAYVQNAQHARKSYSVDLYPQPDEFPVSWGGLIAKSGQTGIGAPHLHWEMRNAQQEPRNPRLLNITWPDTTVPTIKKILLVPLSNDALVNGETIPLVISVEAVGEGSYRCAPITVKGAIGVGVDLVDPGRGGYRLGVHRLVLSDASGEVFRVQHDTLSYNNHRNAAVSYYPYLRGEGRFLLAYRWPGNRCASYAHSPGNGWVTMGDTATELTVQAVDFVGNMATVEIPLHPAAPDTTLPIVAAPDHIGGTSMDCYGNDLTFTVRFPGEESEAPVLLMENGMDMTATPLRSVDGKMYRTRVTPIDSGLHTYRIKHPRVTPFEKNVEVFRRGDPARSIRVADVAIRVQSNSPYGTLFLAVEPVKPKIAPKLPTYGPAWQIWPKDAPIDALLEISFPLPTEVEKQERLQVFRMGTSKWSRIVTRRDGERLVITTRELGTFQILEDNRPPSLLIATPPEGYQAQSRRPKIRAEVADRDSGIATYDVYCDDQWLLTAYDPENKLIRWERDEDLPPGEHTLRIRVSDNVGNITEQQRHITIPE